MKGYHFILVFCTLAVLDAGIPEYVWLRDLDNYNNMRQLDVNLTEKLHVQFYREGKWICIHLKENPHIRADTDIYVVQSLSDGSRNAVKATLTENTDIKYYHDPENRAYFTVRCVKTVQRPCARTYEGILRIEDKDLKITPVSDPEYLDRIYNTHGSSDTLHFIQEHRAYGGRNKSSDEDVDLSNDYKIAANDTEEENIKESLFVKLLKSLEILYAEKKASAKHRKASTVYGLEVLVVVDPPIWTKFYALAKGNTQNAMNRVREYISQVMNGADLRFKTIGGRPFSIYVTLKAILIVKTEGDAPFIRAKPFTNNGVSYINESYLGDFTNWVLNSPGMPSKSDFDHAMMGTGYTLNGRANGIIYLKDVCTGTGISILGGYFMRMLLAIHELSHNPDTGHNGNVAAEDCDIGFIMHSITNNNHKPWELSMCSVDSFENNLATKSSVRKETTFNDMQKNDYNKRLYAGQMYGPEKQCKAAFGEQSYNCNGYCKRLMSAYRTPCGTGNMWCIDGRCVSKASGVTNPNTTSTTSATTTKPKNQSATCRDIVSLICKAGYKISKDQVKFCSDMGKYCCATCNASGVTNPNTTSTIAATTTKPVNQSATCRDIVSPICKAGYKISKDQVKFCSDMGKYCCATCNEKAKCKDTGYYEWTCDRIQTFYSSQSRFCSKWASYCCGSCSSTDISREVQVRLLKMQEPS